MQATGRPVSLPLVYHLPVFAKGFLFGGCLKLTKILGSPIAFHRCLAELAGSVTSGLMLSQAVYWTGKTKDPQGWFWKTQDEWFEETMLSRKEQESARRRLREIVFEGKSLWCEQLRGVPAKLYYRVDMDILECLLTADQHVQNGQASMPEMDILESPKRASKQAQNGHTFLLAETTTETTTETTAESVSAREALVISQETAAARPHTPQGIDPVAIALEAFPMMPIYHQETIDNAGITQSHLWRKAVEDWKANRYSTRNITGLIDKYYRLEKQESRDKEYQNGQNGISTRTTTRTTAGERKAGEYLALQRKLGADASNDPDYKPLPGFEWLESIR